MFNSHRLVCLMTVFLVTLTSFEILNVSAEVDRQSHSTELYGETDAEKMGELSIIDVLLRKRRDEGCDNANEKVDEVFYEKVKEVPIIDGNETEISVEQAEIVSYEEIINGGENVETNTSAMADFLIPPAENANCTNYAEDHEETKTTTPENTEKTLAVDAASGTVLGA